MRRAADSDGAPLLRLQGLSAAAAGRVLLTGLDLELRRGQIVALRGPSGCGKTTLLRTVAMLIDPAAGSLELQGRAPAAIGWASYRRQVSYLAQRPVLLDGNVRENLELACRFSSAAHRQLDLGRASHLLGQLGLDRAMLEQQARAASEGEQQRICLVRALLNGPRVLLLDEPTSALDPDSTARVEALLERYLGEYGAAALLVTHASAQCLRLGAREIDLGPLLSGGGDTDGSVQGHG